MHLTFKPSSDNCHVMQCTNLVRFENHQKLHQYDVIQGKIAATPSCNIFKKFC